MNTGRSIEMFFGLIDPLIFPPYIFIITVNDNGIGIGIRSIIVYIEFFISQYFSLVCCDTYMGTLLRFCNNDLHPVFHGFIFKFCIQIDNMYTGSIKVPFPGCINAGIVLIPAASIITVDFIVISFGSI